MNSEDSTSKTSNMDSKPVLNPETKDLKSLFRDNREDDKNSDDRRDKYRSDSFNENSRGYNSNSTHYNDYEGNHSIDKYSSKSNHEYHHYRDNNYKENRNNYHDKYRNSNYNNEGYHNDTDTNTVNNNYRNNNYRNNNYRNNNYRNNNYRNNNGYNNNNRNYKKNNFESHKNTYQKKYYQNNKHNKFNTKYSKNQDEDDSDDDNYFINKHDYDEYTNEGDPHCKQIKLYVTDQQELTSIHELDLSTDRIVQDNWSECEYKRRKNDEKTVVHWGQRKLLFSEIEFLLNYCPEDTGEILYVGSAPGKHMLVLNYLFPEIHFSLYDPASFNLPSPSQKYTIFKQFFYDTTAKEWSNWNATHENYPLFFISDIRSVSWMNTGQKEVEDRVKEDLLNQEKCHFIIKPERSLLKYRLPWYDETFKYVKGDVYLQLWSPPTSSETRLVPKSNDEKDRIDWDCKKYESQLFYWQTHKRALHYKLPVQSHILDSCYDCVCESKLLIQYLEKHLYIWWYKDPEVYNDENNKKPLEERLTYLKHNEDYFIEILAYYQQRLNLNRDNINKNYVSFHTSVEKLIDQYDSLLHKYMETFSNDHPFAVTIYDILAELYLQQAEYLIETMKCEEILKINDNDIKIYQKDDDYISPMDRNMHIIPNMKIRMWKEKEIKIKEEYEKLPFEEQQTKNKVEFPLERQSFFLQRTDMNRLKQIMDEYDSKLCENNELNDSVLCDMIRYNQHIYKQIVEYEEKSERYKEIATKFRNDIKKKYKYESIDDSMKQDIYEFANYFSDELCSMITDSGRTLKCGNVGILNRPVQNRLDDEYVARHRDMMIDSEIEDGEIPNDAIKKDAIKKDDIKEDAIKEDNIKKDDIKEDDILMSDTKEDDIKEDDIKEDDIKEDDIKADDIKADNIEEDDIKADDVKEDSIKADNIKEDNIKKDGIKEDNIKEDDIKEDAIKEDDIKEDGIKEDDVLMSDIKEDDIKKDDIKEDNIKKDAIIKDDIVKNDTIKNNDEISNIEFTNDLNIINSTSKENKSEKLSEISNTIHQNLLIEENDTSKSTNINNHLDTTTNINSLQDSSLKTNNEQNVINSLSNTEIISNTTFMNQKQKSQTMNSNLESFSMKRVDDTEDDLNSKRQFFDKTNKDE